MTRVRIRFLVALNLCGWGLVVSSAVRLAQGLAA